MLLQCQILMLNDNKASHNEVYAPGTEPCRLFQLALHAVYCFFLISDLTLTLMPAGLPYIGMKAPCTQHCACPLSCSALCWSTMSVLCSRCHTRKLYLCISCVSLIIKLILSSILKLKKFLKWSEIYYWTLAWKGNTTLIWPTTWEI